MGGFKVLERRVNWYLHNLSWIQIVFTTTCFTERLWKFYDVNILYFIIRLVISSLTTIACWFIIVTITNYAHNHVAAVELLMKKFILKPYLFLPPSSVMWALRSSGLAHGAFHYILGWREQSQLTSDRCNLKFWTALQLFRGRRVADHQAHN